MARLDRSAISVESAQDIMRARQEIFFHPLICWLINFRVSQLLKWECRLNLCVYVAVAIVCFSDQMERSAFVFLVMSKTIALKILDELSVFDTNTLQKFSIHWLSPATCSFS